MMVVMCGFVCCGTMQLVRQRYKQGNSGNVSFTGVLMKDGALWVSEISFEEHAGDVEGEQRRCPWARGTSTRRPPTLQRGYKGPHFTNHSVAAPILENLIQPIRLIRLGQNLGLTIS
jgi:hypothetical protein